MEQVFRYGQVADDERIPVPISPLDQVTCLGRAFDLTMPLDFDGGAQFSWNAQQPTIKPNILASGELAQLDAMPLIATFETWEAPSFVPMAQKYFQGFVQSVGKCLHGGCRNKRAAPTDEQFIEGMAIQKSA